MESGFTYLESAELTNVGCKRRNNEDSLLRLPAAGVYCVADGMGGVKGGEMASKATVAALAERFAAPEASAAITAASSAALVRRALNDASGWIKDQAEERGLTGTGSTAVVLLFDRVMPDAALILHAGDSRAYRWRGGKLAQLSVDHSVAAAAGVADERDLPPIFRGVITRAVGLAESVELEETPVDVAPGDIFLLCSDGLSKMVSDKLIVKLLRKLTGEGLDTIAERLVNEALRAGGDDNVSVVLVRVAASIPRGPTMEVPEATLALERAIAAEEAQNTSTEPEEERETGQTAVTGHTIDSARLAGEGVTPPEVRKLYPLDKSAGQEAADLAASAGTRETATAGKLAHAPVDTEQDTQLSEQDTPLAEQEHIGMWPPSSTWFWLGLFLFLLIVVAAGAIWRLAN